MVCILTAFDRIIHRQAAAGLILSMDYEPATRARGVLSTVSEGGNLAYLQVRDSLGNSVYSSAIAFNHGGRGYAYITAHQAVHSADGTYTIGTGANYHTNPGTLFSTTDVVVHSSYTGNYFGMDLALLRFSSPLESAPDLHFAHTPVSGGQQLRLADYGELAVLHGSSFGRTGDAREGSIYRISSNLFGIADPDFYFRMDVGTFDSQSNGGRDGSSGSPAMSLSGELQGMVDFGPVSLSQGWTGFLRMDDGNVDFSAFHDTYVGNLSVVPEPTSLGFIVASMMTAVYGASRKRRRN